MRNIVKIVLFSVMLSLLLMGCGSNGGGEQSVDGVSNSETTNKGESNREDEAEIESEDEGENTVTSTDMELSPYLVRAKSTFNNLYGYVDVRSGEMVIEPQFATADDYFGEDGWACVRNVGDQEAIINTSGEFAFAYGSHEDINADYYEGKYIVTRDGNEVNLYEGTRHIKTLEFPQNNVKKVGFGLVWPKTSSYSLTPERYIPINVYDDADEVITNWFDHTGTLICSVEDGWAGNLVGDSTGYYYFGDGGIHYYDCDGNFIKKEDPNEGKGSWSSNWIDTERIDVAFDGDNWYAAVNDNFVLTNGMQRLEIRFRTDACSIEAKDGIISVPGSYYNTAGEVIYEYVYGSALSVPWYSFLNGYTLVEEGTDDYNGYIDATGKEVYPVAKEDIRSYSKALKDGYIIYGEDGLYGIKNLDGRTICESTYKELFYMEEMEG